VHTQTIELLTMH